MAKSDTVLTQLPELEVVERQRVDTPETVDGDIGGDSTNVTTTKHIVFPTGTK